MHNVQLYIKRWTRRTPSLRQAFPINVFGFGTDFTHASVFDPKSPHERPEPFADMWAAIFTHLIRIGKINDPGVLRDALWCCCAILQDQGYERCYVTKDVLPKHNSAVAILVPGCQTEIILKQRAVVAAQFYRKMVDIITTKTFCLLSGYQPKERSKVVIPNESGKLREHFLDYLAESEGKHREDLKLELTLAASNVPLDDAATKTVANVANFISELCKRNETPSLIVGISSTFHLIRLAQQLEVQLEEYFKSSPPEEDLKILLVGAETDEGIDDKIKSPVLWHPAYMKSLFFEVFSYLAKHGMLPPYGETR